MITKRIYIDCEFTDFINRELISIAAVVKESYIGAAIVDGFHFYAESIDYNEAFVSEWVKLNVYPLMLFSNSRFKETELSARLWDWFDSVSTDKIQIVTDYEGDYELLLDLLGEKHPKFCDDPIFIYDAFISACQAKSLYDKEFQFTENLRDVKEFYFLEFMGWFPENGVRQHHAFNDARAIKYAFENTINEFPFLEVLRNV